MATRIFVQCRTSEMPGSDAIMDKELRMANAACQKVWNRALNDRLGGDRLTTFGGFVNPKCFLLIDVGPEEATEYAIVALRWDGNRLVDQPGPISAYILNEFRTKYHFNPANRPKLSPGIRAA
ncbi:hypothetical protein D0Z07_6699 [Hyphodiscus hymeniophilus]|uniref:Uncharacterized protein n=1 Tax=Hyphodiscus hymeniophilus TaxID=353542 RepID=A0A9P6VGU3_9HELO|nr:hypothetical protein D0Z07_6699 [Hyphodiscus hymeniophilus]